MKLSVFQILIDILREIKFYASLPLPKIREIVFGFHTLNFSNFRFFALTKNNFPFFSSFTVTAIMLLRQKSNTFQKRIGF